MINDISVIIPVGGRHSNLRELYIDYRTSLEALGMAYEVIFVVDGPNKDVASVLSELVEEGEPISVIGLSKCFGESTAIMAAVAHASGRLIMTLPAYHQVDAREIAKLVNAIDDCDMVIGRRWPRYGTSFDRLRRAAFHWLLASVTRRRYRDLGCGARLFERRVLDDIHLYGEQHRFLALLADRQGFTVREVDLRQSDLDRNRAGYGVRDYVRSLLDVFTVFFLTRFTNRPLRFFGTAGALTAVVGTAVIFWIVFERMVFGLPMAERPALILASLLVVLGLQVFALGLLGELIIFTHARDLRDFQVERIVKYGTTSES